jgi:Concanavalin A-like lectin/glucanases superfamily
MTAARTSAIALFLFSGVGFAQSEPPALQPFMPRVDDATQMWWAEGFPSHTPTAPWLRVVQTGRYAMALNTQTLKIQNLGAVKSLNDDWRKLPPADLALHMVVDGTRYACTEGGQWSRYTGPRLIESGRHFQRADVTDLVFAADDGSRLNVDARFETAAWSDRLGLILAARPGKQAIPAGEGSFGRVGGGFGLDGTNHFEVPHRPELDPEQFTLELWAFIPTDYQVSQRTPPWLVCKNRHEQFDGNFGIVLSQDRVQARLNIGGGKEDAFVVESAKPHTIRMDTWNHMAISYDGESLRLYLNGASAGEKKIGRKRKPGSEGLAFGRRQDNSGDGYHFRGVVDEIRLYDCALALNELRQRWNQPEATRPGLKPVAEWLFDPKGRVSMTQPREEWKTASMEIRLKSAASELRQSWELPKDQTWNDGAWQQVSLAFDPATWKPADSSSAVKVAATEFATKTERPVVFESAIGWHRINLDDIIERVKLVLTNPSDQEQIARLMFEKTTRGIRQNIGSSITGVSAMLRDSAGHPTGIPVQLSKNWHNEPEGGVYAGQWFHGISQVHLPAKATLELELTLAYGHWGGVAAASHSQLSLIGWGNNQLWDQSALGAWGESICYEPDQAQANCTITDVRPVMAKNATDKPWGWTGNVGGGDFFRCFNAAQERVPHSAMRTTYHKQGPCLTEVTYAGRIGATMTHAITTSLARTDDIVRGTYRVRLDVHAPTEYSRFVFFQIGADTYNSTSVRKMAFGNEKGLTREWITQPGGDTYRTAPIECTGRVPWVSLHEAAPIADRNDKALANRGIVIRAWNAKLGGKTATPWIAERGLTRHKEDTTTLDLVPPPGITRFEPGDFVEATLEFIIMPMSAAEYYGPNTAMRTALTQDANTWRMIQREASGNDRTIEMKRGTLVRTHPAVTLTTENDEAEFTLTGGLSYVPITFTGLTSPNKHGLLIDGQALNQSIHGNDFWQTDYDPITQRWSLTFNVPADDARPRTLRLSAKP